MTNRQSSTRCASIHRNSERFCAYSIVYNRYRHARSTTVRPGDHAHILFCALCPPSAQSSRLSLWSLSPCIVTDALETSAPLGESSSHIHPTHRVSPSLPLSSLKASPPRRRRRSSNGDGCADADADAVPAVPADTDPAQIGATSLARELRPRGCSAALRC